ncbi:hypothetical protein [Cellulomonas taurus]|uniref:hypothetical protein n=1 Tax=Cellulomonas taurus TaxID=2729175 RepID=UPI00145CCBA9|nr:hypothetical protein [Cellulomonas taurus]
MTEHLGDLQDEVLIAAVQGGLDDWVSLGDLEAMAIYYGAPSVPSPSGEQMAPEEYVLPVIVHLLENELARIGDVYTQGEFVPYDGSDQDALAWISRLYREHEGVWHWLAWLDLTPAGVALAKSLPTAAYHLHEEGDPR